MTEAEALQYAVEVLSGLSVRAATYGTHSREQMDKHNKATAVLMERLAMLAVPATTD